MSNRGAECLSGVVTITQGFSDDSLEILPTKFCTSAGDVASNSLVDMNGPMLGNSHGVSVEMGGDTTAIDSEEKTVPSSNRCT